MQFSGVLNELKGQNRPYQQEQLLSVQFGRSMSSYANKLAHEPGRQHLRKQVWQLSGECGSECLSVLGARKQTIPFPCFP